MKTKFVVLLLFALSLSLSTIGQNKQTVDKRIKEIRKAYYSAKNADTSEDVPHRNFKFSVDAGPDIPAIGWYSADFQYNMLTGLVTGTVTRAAMQEYYELLYLNGKIAFFYEKNKYNSSEIRIYFDNGKIIKAYTKDAGGNSYNQADPDLDYKLITNIVKNLDTLFNSNCGCEEDDE